MNEVATVAARPPGLIERTAQQYGVDPDKLMNTLKATCFKTEKPVTNEQMMSLLIVAEQYHLNPFTRELFAFDDKRGGIIPFVSIDGWVRITNEHKKFDGMEFAWSEEQKSVTCTMYRTDRTHPTVVTEYMAECKRGTSPWQSHPRRMLRHKALVQCARVAFGFAGLYDEDEAARIREGGPIPQGAASRHGTALARVLEASERHFAGETIDAAASEVQEMPEGSLADLTAGLLAAADDQDSATLILDRGRGLLGEEEYSELAATYASIFDKDEP